MALTEDYVAAGGVDFDGVIHRYSKGWQDGQIYDPPNPGALDGLKTLMRHYAIFVHTSRNPVRVAEWLIDQGIPAVADDGQRPMFWKTRNLIMCTSRKFAAEFYLDDRGIRFYSWDQALGTIGMFKAMATQQRAGLMIPTEEVAGEAAHAILGAESVREALGLALGAASMCWSETPQGVFESGRASVLIDALIERIATASVGLTGANG